MSAAHIPQRTRSGNAATIVFAVLHAGLVLVTAFCVVGVFFIYEQDFHDRCRIHGLNCGAGARVSEAVWIGVGATAVLIIVDLLLTMRLLRQQQRLSFLVPLLCCVGQFIVVGTVLSLGAGTV